jgi:hypothetical protein
MSGANFEPWNHEAVLRAFGELTGIRLRVVPEEVKRQAFTFASHFTLRELETVVLYVRRQIARNEGGLSAASLQWHVMMGSIGGGADFLNFQNRLGLAEEAMKRGWRPPFALCAAPVHAARTVPAQSEYDRILVASQRKADEKLKGGR